LYCFPLEHRTEEGQLFWSNPKRPPIALTFDPSDEEHINFVLSTANIFAYVFGMPYVHDRAYVTKIAKSVNVVAFTPQNVVLKESDKDTKVEKADDDESTILTLSDEL
jgi:ubiquitin-activating enzyme E1